MTNPKPVFRDEPYVIGGKGIPEQIQRPCDVDPATVPQDELGFLAFWLMKLHPEKVPAELKNVDLLKADDELKGCVIKVMHEQLGVAPIRADAILHFE
jgi:hypothetical protein